MHSFCIPSSNAACADIAGEGLCGAEKAGDKANKSAGGALSVAPWEGGGWLGAPKKEGGPIGPDILLGIWGNAEGLMTAGPWGTDIVAIEALGFTGGRLNIEAFGKEVIEGDGDVPKKLGWVRVGAVAGRWASGITGKGDGPGLGVWDGFPNTLDGDALGAGFWKLNGRGTGAFTLASELSAGIIEDFDASLELVDAKVPLIVDNSGGVFGLLSVGDWASDESVFTGRVLKAGLGATVGGWDDFALSSSSSSCPDKTAFARGELRVGLVLGRPSPIPKGVIGVLLDREGLEPANDFDSLAGVPGGVVLGSLAGDKLEDR